MPIDRPGSSVAGIIHNISQNRLSRKNRNAAPLFHRMQKCGTGQYCILNWTDAGCTSGVSTYSAGTTTTIRGRCAPVDEYYNVCQRKPNAEVSMTPVSGMQCGNGTYCILNWANETCASAVGTYGNNTTTRVYGRCSPYNEYYNACQRKTGGEVSMTLNKGCEQENTFCYLAWGNQTCANVGTYGNNTQTDLYGVCLSYDGNGEKTCPFQ